MEKEKKEIWIEKLIELLNEYRNDWVEEYLENIKSFKIKWWHYSDLYVISKKFWFIKWLVENDKINTESWPLYWFHFIMSNRQPYSFYETLLMILSISDTPIEDLISYLHE